VQRQLHESLWYLAEAAVLPAAAPLAGEVAALRDRIEALTSLPADALAGLDVGSHRRDVGDLLDRVSTLVRRDRPGQDLRNADLVGRDLRRRDLRNARLRGAYLIGADLRGAHLGTADLLGADLRDTDVRGADLRGCLFLTGPQLTAARGDMSTRLPVGMSPPPHWREDLARGPVAAGRTAGPGGAG
jgi:hypothetical protein